MSVYVCIIQHGNPQEYLLMAEGSQVVAWQDLETGLEYFEAGYRHAHERSHQSSMSACIHWLCFHPSIVVMHDLEDIKDRIIGEPDPKEGGYPRVKVFSVAGIMEGFKCQGKDAAKLWEQGVKPSLMPGPPPLGDKLEHFIEQLDKKES